MIPPLIVGLSNNDKSVYRKEVGNLTTWWDNNILLLNPTKTKKMIIDFRKSKVNDGPVTIDNVDIDIFDYFNFLGSMISNNLKRNINVNNNV